MHEYTNTTAPPARLRRTLQFPLIRIALAALALFAVIAAVQLLARTLRVAPHTAPALLATLVLIAGVLGTYGIYVRLVERRTIAELNLRRAAPEFGLGCVIGALLFGTVIGILWAAGVWRAGGADAQTTWLYPLAGAAAAGFTEEILMRGVVFRILETWLGSWAALALSALFFGVLHALNPGATIVSTLAIALEAGILLAAAFMYSRRLWLPIGLHAAWNFTEGGIFGANVSGGASQGLLISRFRGPELLTGGKFGPEASLVAVLVCLVAGAGFILLARRRGQILAPSWRRHSRSAE